MNKTFSAVCGDITAEAITSPSWLLRSRTSDVSLTAPFDGVCTLVKISDTECEVRGYISHDGITGEDRRALQSIAKQLGFKRVSYERLDACGRIRAAHSTDV